MPQTVQLRRGSAAAWLAADPVLAAGEVGIELVSGKFKIGDGVLKWSLLGYATDVPLLNYLKLDQTTPQTITGGAPILNAGIKFGSAALVSPPQTGLLEFYAGRWYISGTALQRVIDRTGNVVTASVNAVGSAETTIYTALLSSGAAKVGRIYKIHCDGVIKNKATTDDVTFYFYREKAL